MANSSQAPTGSSGAAGQASRTAEPSAGALTETHEAQTHSPILRLRGEHPSRGRGPRVQWAEGVVDNEGMGKKSSKGESSPLLLLRGMSHVFLLRVGYSHALRVYGHGC